jgi:hypothetical protein
MKAMREEKKKMPTDENYIICYECDGKGWYMGRVNSGCYQGDYEPRTCYRCDGKKKLYSPSQELEELRQIAHSLWEKDKEPKKNHEAYWMMAKQKKSESFKKRYIF